MDCLTIEMAINFTSAFAFRPRRAVRLQVLLTERSAQRERRAILRARSAERDSQSVIRIE